MTTIRVDVALRDRIRAARRPGWTQADTLTAALDALERHEISTVEREEFLDAVSRTELTGDYWDDVTPVMGADMSRPRDQS